MEPILSVRELTKTFSRPGQGKQTAVNGVSFDLRPGERLGIIGESGGGNFRLRHGFREVRVRSFVLGVMRTCGQLDDAPGCSA